MKETRRLNAELVETEGKCQLRNKNSQQINANDKHTSELKRRDAKANVDSTNKVVLVLNTNRFGFRRREVFYEINMVSALNLLRPIKYSITHKHTFVKANNDHAAPPLKTPKGHLIGQWM